MNAIVDYVIFLYLRCVMDCLTLLRQDIDGWNQWRAAHPGTPCSLSTLNLSQGYFFEGNFSSVDLSGADLSRACLIGADFSYANLTGVDLSEAYLGEANFTGANLSGANLAGAHVERVNFAQALGISAPQLERVAEEREVAAVLGTTALESPVLEVTVAERTQRRQPVKKENVYDPGIRRAISRLRLGPQAHESRLFRMMTSTGTSR